MKYDEQYPDIPIDGETASGLWRNEHQRPCVICGELTNWLDISYLCIPMCSRECELKFLEPMFKANKKLEEDDETSEIFELCLPPQVVCVP